MFGTSRTYYFLEKSPPPVDDSLKTSPPLIEYAGIGAAKVL